MKKRVFCLVLAVILLFNLSTSAFAARSDVSIVIDNERVQFTNDSGKPFVDENGRTQVPVRIVMEQYGCTVEWDSGNNAAVITKGNTTVMVPIGKAHITVNGNIVPIDTAALIRNGRTYLPIRAVLEAFGADVNWDNGTVSVTSPASGEFENIYIDKDGSLIFELANGNKINAGYVSVGKDGRDGTDGISVTDAYVDGSGNLMITLSNGRTINAGNVGAGGSMSGLTFADYSVGTKFYVTHPVDSYEIPVKVKDIYYTVKIDSIYYELTAKRNSTDPDAWYYMDLATYFLPYEITMYINGSTDVDLVGKRVSVVLSDTENNQWAYNAEVCSDGSFKIASIQGDLENFVTSSTFSWYVPKTLILHKVGIGGLSITP